MKYGFVVVAIGALGAVLGRTDEFNRRARELRTEVAAINALHAKALTCFPKIENDGARFCTGLLLKPADVDALFALTLEGCQNEMKSRGFETYVTQRPANVAPAAYESFIRSNKLGQAFFDEKVVLLKAPVEPLTCIHELLHVRQHSPALEDPFAPVRRRERQDRILKELASVAKLVEAKESAGDRNRAQVMADQLTPVFRALERLQGLAEVLDEKDVHGFLWLACRTGTRGCSDRQVDVALANLLLRRGQIPTTVRALVIRDALAHRKKLSAPAK